jgi:hypothetical protein
MIFVLVGSVLVAGPKYEITLDSGATYTVEKLEDGSYQVSASSGEQVGSLTAGSRAGEGAGGAFDVFDAEGNLLGTAELINPDALELIDQHVRGGS